MALVKCPGCEKDVLELAQTCPHCGLPVELTSLSDKAYSKSNTSIAIVSYYFFPLYGGLETQLLLLSRFLVDAGCDITVFTSLPEITAPVEDQFGINIRRYGSSSTLQGLKKAYSNILRDLKHSLDEFDILYMPLGIGEKYPLSQQLQVAQLFLSRQKPVVLRITSSGRVNELLRIAPSSASTLRRVSRIVSLNDGIASELRMAGVNEETIFCVPNGVDVKMFTPERMNDNRDLNRDRPFRIVYPCRICEKKNLSALISDWRRVQALDHGFNNAELCVIGDDNHGTEDQNLYDYVKELAAIPSANIRLVSSATYWDMPELYRMADIFISYSLQEGMSNATLEAMASGLPIIAPDTDAFRPLLHDSPNFLFRNPTERLRALLTAVRERSNWRDIGFFNRNRIVERFSAEKVLTEYFQMLESLITKQRCNIAAINYSRKKKVNCGHSIELRSPSSLGK